MQRRRNLLAIARELCADQAGRDAGNRAKHGTATGMGLLWLVLHR
jgi:hypothetical protein